jgi:hypothetical protein
MDEPGPRRYPYEQEPTRLDRFFSFLRKGETRRTFKVAPDLDLVAMIVPGGRFYRITRSDPDRPFISFGASESEGSVDVLLDADEARGVKEVLEGNPSASQKFRVIESQPSAIGRFFGKRPETKTVVAPEVFVRRQEEGDLFVVRAVAASFPLPQSVTLTRDEAANLAVALSLTLEREGQT